MKKKSFGFAFLSGGMPGPWWRSINNLSLSRISIESPSQLLFDTFLSLFIYLLSASALLSISHVFLSLSLAHTHSKKLFSLPFLFLDKPKKERPVCFWQTWELFFFLPKNDSHTLLNQLLLLNICENLFETL